MTQDITRFTRAKIFSAIGKRTPTFARFFTVAGERSAADAERDIRGFAVEFYNPFDRTKVWPKKDYPLIKLGVMELNRYPDNYFAEVEQAAFSPANVMPGIGFSPDKMLQARLFSYGDTQRYRLGVNFNHIPVNAPKCPYHTSRPIRRPILPMVAW